MREEAKASSKIWRVPRTLAPSHVTSGGENRNQFFDYHWRYNVELEERYFQTSFWRETSWKWRSWIISTRARGWGWMGRTYKMRKEAWTSEPLALGFGCRSRTLPGEGEGKRNKKKEEIIQDFRRTWNETPCTTKKVERYQDKCSFTNQM